MAKITFMGAGSTVFVRNVLGDCMCREALKDSHFALYDIDGQRLKESEFILKTLNANINDNRATITSHLGVENRKEALRGADFVVNAIQVGGYEPSTVIDFEIPKKFGLRQTIADTLGIGGIFRALRTIPVMLDFARDIEEVAPNAWFLNYTNPMSMLTGAMLRGTSVKTVGLCHSSRSARRACSKRSAWSAARNAPRTSAPISPASITWHGCSRSPRTAKTSTRNSRSWPTKRSPSGAPRRTRRRSPAI